MKKLVSLFLAFVMVFSMAMPVFAADAVLDGHTYKAYQIFTGTQAPNEDELGDVDWGAGINGPAFLADLQKDTTFAGCTSAAAVAEKMATWADDSENAKAFAALAYKHIQGDGADVGETLAAGYYLVVDVTKFGDGATNTVYNLALLQLTKKGIFEIKNKTDVPEVEKKVKDVNDFTGETTGWQDSADYDIGDHVPFLLKATLASNVADYDYYKVVFHDTLSAGLTYDSNAVVKIDDEPVAAGSFSISYDSGKLTVSCDDVKALGAGNSSVITVEYTATLNTNAVLGAAGNPNTVYLEYSNNPNWKPEGTTEPTGKTPTDKVIVFTYKTIVNKVDEDGAALVGAGFTLYKEVGEDNWVAVGKEVKGQDMTQFTWTGLDDGNYKLVETTTPPGYNTMTPLEFTITAEHDTNSPDPKLTSLTGGNKFTGDVNAGTLTGDIENQKGTTLPETGGIGRTIFYVLGAVLVIGAGVVLVSKKRMED